MLEGPHGLLQGFGEGAADRHRLPHRLHAGTEDGWLAGELLEGPPRDLGDDVVDRRLETRRRLAGDVVGYLVEGVTDGETGGDLGDREAGGLAGERGGARDPRIHLDHDHLTVFGIDRELDVRAAGVDPDATDAEEGGVPHLLILDVGERLGRGDRDRVAGVDPHRVDVLDRADDYAVVGPIAHDFELVLLPAGDRTLDQDLRNRAGCEALSGETDEVVLVCGDPGAGPAQDERGPDDDRIADLIAHLQRLVERVGETGGRDVEPDLQHRRLETFPVLRRGDGLRRGADQLASEAFEGPVVGERHRQVQRRLAAEGREHRIGALLLDDRRQGLGVERLHIGRVGEVRVGHDRGGVGVGEDDSVTLLLEDPACLGP